MPGRNCWRIERATRASVLIDGAEYFDRLDQALSKARRSIFILGWDFDAAIRLGRDRDASQPLGTMLRKLVDERPELEVRILVWSLALVHTPGSTLPLLLSEAWEKHPRIHLRLDREHPIYAAHHQKAVCIDDRVAFVGGIDLTVDRWDTPAHEPDESRRVQPNGTPYGPVHDLQFVVEGVAARALGDLARQRWLEATGEELEPAEFENDIWPADLEAEFRDVDVGISRTQPAWRDRGPVYEIARLTEDILRSARRTLYIEAQYLASPLLADVLCESLQRPDGPEVVIVTTLHVDGLLAKIAMGTNRDRLIRRLKRADRFGRILVLYPVNSRDGDETEIMIHAKLIIADDQVLRIGSSNLNNRSEGLDTECDLTIDAADDDTRRSIALLRHRLVAEHIGQTARAVERACAEEGSLIRVIERFNDGSRTLRAFDAMHTRGATRPVFGTGLLDPKKPLRLLSPLSRLRRS